MEESIFSYTTFKAHGRKFYAGFASKTVDYSDSEEMGIVLGEAIEKCLSQAIVLTDTDDDAQASKFVMVVFGESHSEMKERMADAVEEMKESVKGLEEEASSVH